MSPIHLRNPFRRDPSGPTLKERVAALPAEIARVTRRKPAPAAESEAALREIPAAAGLAASEFADEVEQAGCEGRALAAGGIDHYDGTVSYCDATGRVFREPFRGWVDFTVMQLHAKVRSEIVRRSVVEANHLSQDEHGAWESKIRRELRADAVFALAFRPNDAFEAEEARRHHPVEAPQVAPSALALACHAAVERLTWVNSDAGSHQPWTDERITEENHRFDAMLARSIDEPARNLNDLAAKARLLAYEWRQSVGDAGGENVGERALGAFLREVSAFERHSIAAPEAPIGSDPDKPATAEFMAGLNFAALDLDPPVRSPQEWAQRLAPHALAFHLADRLVRMEKAEAVAFVEEIDAKDGDAPEAVLKLLADAHDEAKGLVALMDMAETRYLIAASAAAVNEGA